MGNRIGAWPPDAPSMVMLDEATGPIEVTADDCVTLVQMEELARRLRAAGSCDGTRIYSMPGHRTTLTARLSAYVQRGDGR